MTATAAHAHPLPPAAAPAHPASPAGDSSPFDVLVIGAGQAGLAMAWHLARRDVRYVVADAAPEIGHSWRTRWDSLKLFTSARYDALPGDDFPGAPDSYPDKDQVADYLADYADRHAFPILPDTRVTRLVPYDAGLAAHTTQGVLYARRVVVATGAFQVPLVPAIEGSFTVPAVHSSAYQRPADLPQGQVLVVGGANSGLQIAEELSDTREVVLASGTNPPAVPQRLLGRDLFWWLTRLGVMEKGTDSPLVKRMRDRGDPTIGTSRKALRKAGVDLRPRLLGASGRTAWFADGSSVEVDAVVWATGFRPDYSWIDASAVIDKAGVPRHDGVRSLAVPGLWFLGLPWQRTRGSALLGFVHRDAAYLDAAMFDRTPAAHATGHATAGTARTADDTGDDIADTIDTTDTGVGTAPWVQRTSGRLTTAERRALLRPLARTHAQNAVGRLRLAAGLHPGRHAYVAAARLAPPTSVLTRAAEERARRVLPTTLLNHSYRAYVFGRALGELEGTEVDTELLFAAALLHDTGLVNPTGAADFTLTSARLAREVAEEVGLSTAATDTMLTAITQHYTPGVTADAGPVAYLLAAGTAVDVVGLRSWQLPQTTLTDAVREHPRVGFKTAFSAAFRQEAARVPEGRARLLHRYGAFSAAIKFAPFNE